MNNQYPLSPDPLELLLLNRILNKLNHMEREQALIPVLLELKTLQEKGILSDLREVQKRRFDDVDGALAYIQGELWRRRENEASPKEIKGMMESIFDAYFERELENPRSLSFQSTLSLLFLLGGLIGVFLLYCLK